MKLLLTSAGFTNDDIIQACEKLVGKKCRNIKVATIEDAHLVETGDLSWFEEEKARVKELFPKGVETLELQQKPLSEIKKQLAAADMIYCFGGNASYLAKVLEETNFVKILPEILETKVWVGSSAGSCVMCHKESEQTTKEVYQEEDYYDHFLNLVPAVIMPHYHGWFKFEEPEIVREAKKSKYPIYALSDQSALKVTTKQTNKPNTKSNKITLETIGEDYYVTLGGKLSSEVSEAISDAADAVSKAAATISKIFKK